MKQLSQNQQLDMELWCDDAKCKTTECNDDIWEKINAFIHQWSQCYCKRIVDNLQIVLLQFAKRYNLQKNNVKKNIKIAIFISYL